MTLGAAFITLCAIHDAVVKPMADNRVAPSLAESWTASPDVIVAPIWLHAGLSGVGPRVEESGIGLIAGHVLSAPYEDVRLKSK